MIVVYYGVNLSLSLPFCLSSSLLFPFLFLCRPLNLVAFHLLLLYLSSSFSLPLPAAQSRLASPLLFLLLLLRAILLCSRCSARRKYSLFPPLDMAKEAICALLAILEHFFEAFSPLDLFFAPAPFHPVPRPFPASLHPGCRRFPASAHPVSSSIPTSSISRPSAQVNIIPAWFPSLSETSARAVFIFRASVALDFCRSSGPPAVTSSPVFATARCHCPRHHAKRISPSHHVRACAVDHVSPSRPAPRLFLFVSPRSRACPRLRFPAYPCSRSSACAFMCPSASVMAGGPAGPSTQCARDRPAPPDPVGHADHGQNAVRKGCP